MITLLPPSHIRLLMNNRISLEQRQLTLIKVNTVAYMQLTVSFNNSQIKKEHNEFHHQKDMFAGYL